MDFIKKELQKYNIEEQLKKLLQYEEPEKLSIEWGMNYITFSPSKRIRPLLVAESNLIYNKLDSDTYLLSCVVELIHTYSLVHDDLPCIDDDELRRGVKTLHTIKDEAYAVLVGDALLTRTFHILSKYSKVIKLPLILSKIWDKTGECGMIKGQYHDIEGKKKELDAATIIDINKNKTSSLIQLSMLLGGINGGANDDQLSILSDIGEKLGLIFQLQDDILDIVDDKRLAEKKTGNSANSNKSSIPLLIGIDETKKIINQYKKETEELIFKIPRNGVFFKKFLNFLISRDK